ncbi:MAG: RdgB/HAM1 family non-canonical purine NTP pyrophosphatase [Nanoarchaeota archaeon]|nr:RdgB/HAM1 family non-canonical purine NTP pyrophosphatase [Nanoarchaeota archaeon]
MKISFITSNKHKVAEFEAVLKGIAELEHIEIDYPEMRSDDSGEISKVAAKQLADTLKKTIIVEDSGMFIDALKGFPGTCSAYIHPRIGLKGILKLLDTEEKRGAEYISAIGYCEPGEDPKVFVGSERGTIALKERGEHGFGHDPIFIPEGQEKTYAEMENIKDVKKFRRIAIEKLVAFLKE